MAYGRVCNRLNLHDKLYCTDYRKAYCITVMAYTIANGIITVALTVGACDHVPSKAVIPLRFIVTFMDRKSYGQSMSEGMHNHISNVQASCSWQ